MDLEGQLLRKSGAFGAAFLMAGICTMQFSVREGGVGVWGGHLQIQPA